MRRATRIKDKPELVDGIEPLPVDTSPAVEPPEGTAERARPGRRSIEDRQRAVMDLLSGKATVDQVSRRLGVQTATIEGWREDAVAAMSQALRRGTGKTERELELERENKQLREVVTKTAIQRALLEQALDIERNKRPTGPAKSWR